jgi:multidrug efflux pump
MGEMFYQVRKKVGDIRNTLPDGIRGPFFNDEFGDTFGNIFALTGDGYSYADLKDYAERLRREMLRVPDVAKVDLIGLQDEKIYVEMSNTKLATLGHRRREHPVGAAAAEFDGRVRRVRDADRQDLPARVGDFDTVERCASSRSAATAGRSARRHRQRLSRLSSIRRSRGCGSWARSAGLGVSMRKGGDIVELGKNLDAKSTARETTAGRPRARARQRPAARGPCVDQRIRPLGRRGGDDRAGRQLHQPRLAHRHGRRAVDSAGLGD